MENFPKTTRFKAATKLACAIATFHPGRFNEAVHSGAYPCAPKTLPGKSRAFDVNDVIALRCYQRFVSGGMNASMAGQKACSIRAFLTANPEADQVYIVKTAFDDGDGDRGNYRPGALVEFFDPKEPHIQINSTQSVDVVSVEVFNFHYLRGRIVHQIEDAAAVVGD